MDIIFISFLVKNLGLIFTLLFLYYMCLIAIRCVKLYNVLRYAGAAQSFSVQSSRQVPPFLRAAFAGLTDALTLGCDTLVDNRIEQIWIEYERAVHTHFSAINGYIYSIILWGFTGTIWGTIQAFSRMGQTLFAADVRAAEALSSALQGGLNIALYTSLVAATIGAVMVTYLYSRYMFEKSKALEAVINDDIYRIVKTHRGHVQD